MPHREPTAIRSRLASPSRLAAVLVRTVRNDHLAALARRARRHRAARRAAGPGGRGPRPRPATCRPPSCCDGSTPRPAGPTAATPRPPAAWRCRSPAGSARSRTCSAAAPSCGPGTAPATDWRVDAISFAGESGIHHDESGDWTWNYESNTVDRTGSPVPPQVRLPTAGRPDAARTRPPAAEPGTARRGRPGSARPGSPAAARPACGSPPTSRPAASLTSTSGPTPRTGLPLRVRVQGKQSARAVLTSSFLDFSPAEPPAAVTAFSPPLGARVSSQPSAGPGDRHRPAGSGGAAGPAGRPGPQPATAARWAASGCTAAG